MLVLPCVTLSSWVIQSCQWSSYFGGSLVSGGDMALAPCVILGTQCGPQRTESQPHPPTVRLYWGLSNRSAPPLPPVPLCLWKQEKLSLPLPLHFVRSSCLCGWSGTCLFLNRTLILMGYYFYFFSGSLSYLFRALLPIYSTA